MTADDRKAVIDAARALPDNPRIFQVELDHNSYGLRFIEFGRF